jgi:hypothetical protein
MRPHLLLIPACLLCAAPAPADELPKRKAGLWEIRMIAGGRDMPLRNVQQCTDAETDSLLATSLGGVIGSNCDQPKISNSGTTVSIDSRCKVGSKTMATRALITGDFDSAYTVTLTSPSAAGGSSTGAMSDDQPLMTMEARWLGPCREGQRPGDIILPGGIRMNVRSFGIESGMQRQP